MGTFESVVMRSLWRIAKGITGEKIPMLAGHKLLYTCNLRCHMCPFWRRPDETLLTLDEEKKMMDSLADFGVSFMGFEGGEPFLRRDLPEILSYSHTKFYTSLVSNGWALKEKISQVKDSLDHLFVSIDGIGQTHDRLRGMEGSYARAVQGIEAASRYVPVSLSSTITSENCHEVRQIVDLASDLGVTVSFQVAYDYSTADRMSPNAQKLKSAIEELLEMKRRGAPIVESHEYFEAVINSWYKGIPWRCKPWLTLNIDPQGKVVLPCYVLNEYTGSGKVWEMDLRKAWNSVDWKTYESCNKCALSCYLEPSLFNWSNAGMVKERIIDNMLSYFSS
ncbi:MAG: PTO1314 family radical SAM protein [Candidatus Thermoplasmatota archaeon]|jgi:radical SAM family uncharacterized protein|nr:PTO1314 family radical SAM protein [Candidatus Thermoplasmatota archaeon]